MYPFNWKITTPTTPFGVLASVGMGCGGVVKLHPGVVFRGLGVETTPLHEILLNSEK
mgnify:CR=1 FL=1